MILILYISKFVKLLAIRYAWNISLPIHFRISHECKGCLASVGMAVWNCGTFEMDCIKGAIELGSECYACVCEVIDALWPDDAPNCFKKEISKITTTQIDENLSSKSNGSSDTSTQKEELNANVHDEI